MNSTRATDYFRQHQQANSTKCVSAIVFLLYSIGCVPVVWVWPGSKVFSLCPHVTMFTICLTFSSPKSL